MNMKQFEVDKKYKFDMVMKQEFFDDMAVNKDVFYDLSQFNYVITVSDLDGDTVRYKGNYILYQSDIQFFTELEDVVPPSESEVLKAWFEKVFWLYANTEISEKTSLVIHTEIKEPLWNEESVDFVINSYEAYQNKAKQKEKQSLLDKKAELELQLAQINEQLGE